MSSFNIGDTFSNGFYVIETPTSPGNNTGEYLVSNSIGFQYYVTGATLSGYDQVGNNNSSGSSGSSSGGGSTTVVYMGQNISSPYSLIPAGAGSGSSQVVATMSGSMVRLVNLSDQGQPALIVGYDNASTTSGTVLFAQSLNVQQIVDVNVRTSYGITISVLGAPINSDFGVNVVNDTGAAAVMTGYPFTPIPPNASTSVVVWSSSGSLVGLRNNSASDQSATFIGYDNAATTSGRILFRQQLSAGQGVNLKEQVYYGIVVGIVNGPTNADFGVNVLYASTTSG